MAFVAETMVASGGAAEAAAVPAAPVKAVIPAPALRRVRLMFSIILAVMVIDLLLYLPQLF